MNLENDHNVYILGAGFSREAGLPLLPDFLTKMRDCHAWLKENNRNAEADAIQAVLGFRLRAGSAAYWTNLDLENIEELFSLASASDESLNRPIQLAIAATLDYCTSMSDRKTGQINIDNLKCAGYLGWIPAPVAGKPYAIVGRYEHHVAKLLGIFQNGNLRGRNTFLTFNYDTLLEDALSRLQVPFGYGFHHKSVKYDKSAKARGSRYEVEVLKLHGSVNWGKKSGGRRWAFTVFGNYGDLRKTEMVPELIPPTWKKVFQNHIADVWDSAVASLSTATRIVVIGFSMPSTDLHFKYLMSAGLQQNISLRKILFVNPSADEIKSRAHTLLRQQYIDSERIQFRAMGLEDFVRRGEIQWDIERPWATNAIIQFT